MRIYTPSTRPGAPLPHAWIDDEEEHRRPIKDLVGPGRFLLIAGEEGVSPGQACAFYDAAEGQARVLGGGFISGAVAAETTAGRALAAAR